MDKQIVDFIQARKSEITAIWRFLIPLLLLAFWRSFKLWVAVFLISLVANVGAVAVTYFEGSQIRIADFFPPNIGWGLLIVLGVLFVYQSAAIVASVIRDLQAQADKLKPIGIVVDLIQFPSDYIAAYGIKTRNNKPFRLEKLLVRILKFEVDRRDRTPHHLFPVPLALLDDRTFKWTAIDLGSGEEATVALFGTSEHQGKISLFFPGPDGQPGDMKSMGWVDSDEGVLFADLEVIAMLDGNELIKPFRVRAEIVGHDPRVEIVR